MDLELYIEPFIKGTVTIFLSELWALMDLMEARGIDPYNLPVLKD